MKCVRLGCTKMAYGVVRRQVFVIVMAVLVAQSNDVSCQTAFQRFSKKAM